MASRTVSGPAPKGPVPTRTVDLERFRQGSRTRAGAISAWAMYSNPFYASPASLVVQLFVLLLLGCDSSSSGLGPGTGGCKLAEVAGLSVGETARFQGASARTICVSATEPGEEYVMVTTSLAESGLTRLTIENEGVAPVVGPPLPSPGPHDAEGQPLPFRELDALRSNDRLHSALRELERRQLPVMVGEPSATGLRPAPSPGATASVGDLMTFNSQSKSACEDPKLATGRVEAVSDRAIVVADTTNPTGGFMLADFQHFASTFDTLVVPLAAEHFGAASDIDANNRVIIFFTKQVNALSADVDDSFTAGFFFSRDLFPRVSPGPPLGSCASSNEAELLYLLVPDPTGLAGNRIATEDVARFTVVTIGHEYQHLVNASQRLLGPSGPRQFEESWLNEALSHTMEELLFYESSGLSPRDDIHFQDLGQGEVDALNEFQRLNFFRFLEFLKSPALNSPYDAEVSIATRGAAWNFLRYSADRWGGDDAVLFRQLVSSPSTGLQNLAGALGGLSVVLDWVGDWSVGLYGDNRVPGLSPRFQDLSWNSFSLFESAALSGPYIATSKLAPNPLLVRQLTGGGSWYYRFGLEQGTVARLTLSSDGGAPPPSVRATVLRTR